MLECRSVIKGSLNAQGFVGFLERTRSSGNTHLASYFFPQLNSVREAQFQRLEAERPRRPGCGVRGPVLRMAGQPPPWAYTAILLCALSLGRAIEIPMDRESPVRLESADGGRGVGGRGGAGRVRTLQRRQGQQKQWLLDSERVFLQRINPGELMLGNLGPGAAGPSLRAAAVLNHSPEPAESLEARASLGSPSLHTPPSSLCGLD